VTVQLEKALAFRVNDPAKSEQAIRDAKQAARDALSDVRRSVAALRQTAEFFSLTLALQELVRQSANGGLAVELHVEGDEGVYAKSSLMTLYRLAQEGLTNIQKHAQASTVRIKVCLGSETAVLIIHDDGKGFDVTKLTSSQEHQGLQGMKERLALVGGELTVESRNGEGTRITAVVPKQPQILIEGSE